MVTKFLKQKDVQKKFNELFRKPEIENIAILINPTDYNAPLVGNALDYFITCHFNYLKKSETDSFIENTNFCLKDLIRFRTVNTKIGGCYYCYKSTKGSLEFGLMHGSKDSVKSSLRYRGFERVEREVIYIYCTTEISEIIEFALTKYKDYKVRGKITDDFLNALLNLAKILPGIHHQRLGKNLFEYNSQNDLDMLKHLIKQMPKNFYKAKHVSINPHLSCGMVTGEPDYIIDNSIVDIKTTQRFFSRADYNQLICYYILYKIDEKRWNKEGIQINNIGIYYALYGQMIQFNVSDLVSPEGLKEIIALIEDKSLDTSYY